MKKKIFLKFSCYNCGDDDAPVATFGATMVIKPDTTDLRVYFTKLSGGFLNANDEDSLPLLPGTGGNSESILFKQNR